MNFAANTGLSTNATKSDDERTMISVTGRYLMKLPTIPGQNISGKNAASVVAVDEIMGIAISLVPFLTAFSLFTPCSIIRYTFSITTMALSTSIPSASTRLNSTILLMVYPICFKTRNEISIDIGMARPEKMALRRPMKR